MGETFLVLICEEMAEFCSSFPRVQRGRAPFLAVDDVVDVVVVVVAGGIQRLGPRGDAHDAETGRARRADDHRARRRQQSGAHRLPGPLRAALVRAGQQRRAHRLLRNRLHSGKPPSRSTLTVFCFLFLFVLFFFTWCRPAVIRVTVYGPAPSVAPLAEGLGTKRNSQSFLFFSFVFISLSLSLSLSLHPSIYLSLSLLVFPSSFVSSSFLFVSFVPFSIHLFILLLCLAEFHRVLQHFTALHVALPIFIDFYRFLPSFTSFYRFIWSFTDFYII